MCTVQLGDTWRHAGQRGDKVGDTLETEETNLGDKQETCLQGFGVYWITVWPVSGSLLTHMLAACLPISVIL